MNYLAMAVLHLVLVGFAKAVQALHKTKIENSIGQL